MANLRLNGIWFTEFSIDPSFSRTIYSYTGDAGYNLETCHLQLSTTYVGTMTVNGEPYPTPGFGPIIEIPLPNQGDSNPIVIHLICEDLSEITYTIDAIRRTTPSTNSLLENLNVNNATLIPTFDSTTFSYISTVSHFLEETSVYIYPADFYASVKINGVLVNDTYELEDIDLLVGENIITVEVTAEDGITISSYIVTVTREGHIEVWTANDLNNVRNNLGKAFIQKADIDLSGYSNWTAIGTQATPFTGAYDGNNFNITGLKMNSGTSSYRGLFGYLNGTLGINRRIENVNLINVNITLLAEYVGALFGWAQGGHIYNCISSGIVTGRSQVTGGLGGILNTGDIYNCSSSCPTTCTNGYWGGRYVGGLLGRGASITISKCFAIGNVIGGIGLAFGGLIGSLTGNNCYMDDCYATGNVQCSINATGWIGGCIGEVGAAGSYTYAITNSYSCGQVIFSGTTSDYGGFCGLKGSQGTFTSCYYDSDITGLSDTGKGEPRTTAQMKTKSTFINWNFITVWGIHSGENNGYPNFNCTLVIPKCAAFRMEDGMPYRIRRLRYKQSSTFYSTRNPKVKGGDAWGGIIL